MLKCDVMDRSPHRSKLPCRANHNHKLLQRWMRVSWAVTLRLLPASAPQKLKLPGGVTFGMLRM